MNVLVLLVSCFLESLSIGGSKEQNWQQCQVPPHHDVGRYIVLANNKLLAHMWMAYFVKRGGREKEKKEERKEEERKFTFVSQSNNLATYYIR